MESSFSTFLTGPGRYIIIICVAYLLIGLPLTMLYLKKNKAKAKSYLEENPSSAKMMISTRLAFGNLSDALIIIYINNEAPVHFYEKRKLMMELANDDKALKKVFRIKINIGRLLSLISLKHCLITTQKCYGMCKNNKSKYVTIPAGRKHFFGELYKRDGMENTIKVSFEGHNWEIAKNYNDYLTKLYGNYMEIPSEENRETHFRVELKFPDEKKHK